MKALHPNSLGATEDRQKSRNNLNALRLLLALLVLMAHCFPLAQGQEGDPLYWLTRQQETFGQLAVDLFFIISGFFITRSWLKLDSMIVYLRHRVLRIFPGYAVALIFSFGLASVFASHPFAHLGSRLHDLFCDVFYLDFSSCRGDWIFPNNPWKVPMVVNNQEILGSYSNGSLWTINREFACYLLVAGIGLFGFFKRRAAILFVFAGLLAYYTASVIFVKNADLSHYDRRFFTLFLAGACAWLWRDKIPLHPVLAGAALLLTLAATQFSPWLLVVTPVAVAYLLLWAGYAHPFAGLQWCNKTDLSYGVYLFAFPIQQMLVAVALKHQWPLNPWLLFLVATPISLVAAYLSWTWIEKPCLRRKDNNYSDGDVVSGQILTNGTPTTGTPQHPPR